MFSLILIVCIGLGIAFFSQQNTQTVSLTIGNYAFSPIPVYLVSIVSMLVGLFVAWILSLMDFFSTTLLLRRKDSVISRELKRIGQYEKEVAALKHQNAVLKDRLSDHETVTTHVSDETPSESRNYLENIRQRFALHHRKGALT